MVVRNRKRSRAGATVVEFALVATVFLIVLFGIVEFAKVMMVRQVLQNASREGARYAVVHTYDRDTADVIAHVEHYLLGHQVQLVKPPVIQVFLADPDTGKSIGAWTDADFGECIGVMITGEYRLNIPFLVQTIPVQIKTIMYSEAN